VRLLAAEVLRLQEAEQPGVRQLLHGGLGQVALLVSLGIDPLEVTADVVDSLHYVSHLLSPIVVQGRPAVENLRNC